MLARFPLGLVLLCQAAGGLLVLRDAAAGGGRPRIPVWVWWDWPDGVPATFQLNVRTWLRHLPAERFELHFVNKSSVVEEFGDLPEEFWRLYSAAKTDYFRATVLAKRGGIYMDGDMILLGNIFEEYRDVFEGDVDIKPYLWDHQKCPTDVSTNFMAAKKGNNLSTLWLQGITARMKERCPEGLKPWDDGSPDPYNTTVCCYEPDGRPRKKCFINFGAIGDKASQKITRAMQAGEIKEKVNVKCVPAERGMAEARSGSTGELLFKRFLPGPPDGFNGSYTWPQTKWGKIHKFDRHREACWRAGQSDLMCTASGLFPKFFERNGFHQFNVLNNDFLEAFATEEEVFNSQTVMAEVFRAALQGEAHPDPRLAELAMRTKAVKRPPGVLYWGEANNTRIPKLPWLAKDGESPWGVKKQ